MTAKTYFYANGKRKTSVATVRVYEKGTGQIMINDKPVKDFCKTPHDHELILSPLTMTGVSANVDINARVAGGGIHSQSQAVRHGISKALIIMNPEFRLTLKKVGYLTRDSRMKERKKFGLKRARRAPQFSKR